MSETGFSSLIFMVASALIGWLAGYMAGCIVGRYGWGKKTK